MIMAAGLWLVILIFVAENRVHKYGLVLKTGSATFKLGYSKFTTNLRLKGQGVE